MGNGDDLRSSIRQIENEVGKKARGSQVGRVLMASALGLGVLGGGAGLYVAITGDKPQEPSLPTRQVAEFPQDRGAVEALDAPTPPDPVVIERVTVEDRVDTATLSRIADLEAELERARSLVVDREGETAAERALRDEVQRERDRFAQELAALRSTAENDRARANGLLEELKSTLDAAKREAELARTRAESEKVRLEADAAKREADMRIDYERELAALRARPEIDPEEEERRRREEEERRRLEERRAQMEAEERERVRSGMVALANTAEPEAGAGDRRATRNESFVRRGIGDVPVSRASVIANPAFTVPQGTVIQGALETAVDSSLPGEIRAVVSEDVHSLDGSRVLIPGGSKLFGEYSSEISLGQRRILVAWTRILTPDDRSISIASFGADRLGRSGTAGKVDTRFWAKFSGAAAISLIGAGAAAVQSDGGNQLVQSGASDPGAAVASDLNSVTSTAIGEILTIPPRISVKQGAQITIMVDRDLEIF